MILHPNNKSPSDNFPSLDLHPGSTCIPDPVPLPRQSVSDSSQQILSAFHHSMQIFSDIPPFFPFNYSQTMRLLVAPQLLQQSDHHLNSAGRPCTDRPVHWHEIEPEADETNESPGESQRYAPDTTKSRGTPTQFTLRSPCLL